MASAPRVARGRRAVLAGTLCGLALLGAVIWFFGPEALLATLPVSGIPALCASAWRLVPLAVITVSWAVLLPRQDRQRPLTLFRLRWIGESVNNLLPVANTGGDLVRARLLVLHGASAGPAGAALVVVFAIALVSLVVVSCAGAGLFGARAGGLGGLATPIVVGVLVLGSGAVALSLLARPVHRWLLASATMRRALHVQGADPGAALDALLRRRDALVACLGLHVTAKVAHVGETWLVLVLLGAPVSLSTAFIIESLTSAVRAAAFFVPEGLGAQEGTLVLLGGVLGVVPEAALALAVVKRLRELIVGGPALLAWTLGERRLLARLLSRRGGEARSSTDDEPHSG